VKEQGQKLDTTIDYHGTQIEDIKNLLSGLTQQLEFVMQRIPFAAGESSQGRDKQTAHQNESTGRPSYSNEGRPAAYKVHRPKHLFPVFGGGMMCIDGCINAISTLRLRILRTLRN
jgi:hypothetical protein